jgi:hypothetical protein
MTPCRGSLAAGKKLSFECPPLVIGAPRFNNEQAITPLSAEVASLGRGLRDGQLTQKVSTDAVFGKSRLARPVGRDSAIASAVISHLCRINGFYHSRASRDPVLELDSRVDTVADVEV